MMRRAWLMLAWAAMMALPAAAAAPLGYRLHAGQPEQQQLQDWAQHAGWTLVWRLPQQWLAPADADFGNDFPRAVRQLVHALADNGVDIRVDLYLGNHVLVIQRSGDRE